MPAHHISTAGHRSPGFFWLQWPSLNTTFGKTTTFKWSKTDLSKNGLFDENAYLILIGFDRNAIFDVFAVFDRFYGISGHHWFSTGFSLFSWCQVSPLKLVIFVILVRKITKIINFSENHENVTDKPDTSEMTLFRHCFMKKQSIFAKASGFR